MKCIIIDHVHKRVEEIMKEYMETETHLLPTISELKELIKDVDVLIMRADPPITKDIIDIAPKLKIVSIPGIGTNHLDKDYMKIKGIEVVIAPGVNANAVAELTISKMLDLSRDVIPAHKEIVEKKIWDKYKFTGRDMRYRTLGIVGFGAIGRRLSVFAKAFDMKVVAYDPYVPEVIGLDAGVKLMDFKEMLKTCDYITFHVPLTESTYHMLSYEEIALMKNDAIVLNMSRGGVVDEKAIYEALSDGKLGGFGLDVMENEVAGGGLTVGGTKFDSPLFKLDNFVATPHLGGSTEDAYKAVGEFICGRIIEILKLKKK